MKKIAAVSALVVALAVIVLFIANSEWHDVIVASHCDIVDRNAHWLTDDVTTRDELRAEINEMLVDNRCDGITPAKLRKVLLDMEKVK